MSLFNNIYTTEYCKTPTNQSVSSVSTTTPQNTVFGTSSTNPMTNINNNSVFNKPSIDEKDTNTDTYVNEKKTKVQGKYKTIDKLLQEIIICEKLAKYNISIEDIKKNGVLENATGVSLNELEEKLSAKNDNAIEKFKNCIIQGLLDSIENGKINYSSSYRNINNYIVAIITEYDTAQSFKAYDESEARKDTKVSLFERLKKQGFLKVDKNATIDTVSREDLKEAFRKLLDSIVTNDLDPNNEEQRQKIKAQLQTFGRAFINSDDNERIIFFDVAKELHAINKLPAIEAIFISARTPELKAEYAKKAYTAEYIESITCSGSVMSKENSQKVTKLIVENSSEENIPEAHRKISMVRQNWMNANKDKILAIKDKLKANNFSLEKLTPEELEIYTKYQNFVIASSSGEILGIADGNFSEEFKTTQIKTCYNDTKKLPGEAQEEIIEETDNYLNNPQNEFNHKKEEITNVIDKSTGGDYSKAVEQRRNSKPIEKKESTETKTNAEPTNNTNNHDFFPQQNRETYNRDKEHLNQTIQEIQEENKPKTPKYVTTNPVIDNKKETIKDKINKAGSNKEIFSLIEKYLPQIEYKIIDFILSSNNKTDVLNKLPNSLLEHFADKLITANKLTIEEIEELNVTSVIKSNLKYTYYKINKNNQDIANKNQEYEA